MIEKNDKQCNIKGGKHPLPLSFDKKMSLDISMSNLQLMQNENEELHIYRKLERV